MEMCAAHIVVYFGLYSTNRALVALSKIRLLKLFPGIFEVYCEAPLTAPTISYVDVHAIMFKCYQSNYLTHFLPV